MGGYEHFEVAHKHSKHEDQWKMISALVTTILALLIAVSSFGIKNANHHSLILKNEAVDQWSFFQAKSIKERLYDIESQKMSFTENNDKFFNEKAQLAQVYKSEMERYRSEQDGIIEKARYFTEISVKYDEKGNYYELAQVFFELAIVLNAMFLMLTRKFMFYISLSTGAIGLLFLGIGFFYI